MVHDTENLTFSADNREDNPHIAARLSAYVHADNQRIPRGYLEDSARTISGFCVEQLADSVRNSANVKTKITQSIDIRTILAMCFSILQPVVVHEVHLLVSAIFNPNPHGRSAPARTENPCPPALHPPAWKFRCTRAENPRRSSQLSAGVCAEQQWNSSEKVFRVMYRKIVITNIRIGKSTFEYSSHL